ncbi:extracellular solute-binding protein [Planctomonas psychrotolerans]|uniref:extracellular solute-binding protein n=1 Tax=Planctomonas psychrotolerans TaxID=2528712 RepID=UPI001D0D03C2|nr:extracellular solute-binding protein [Planctomonas psychrotolerans]
MIRTKLTTTAAVTAAAALLLTGCGRSADGPAAGEALELSDDAAAGTVTVWAQGTEGEALKEFVAPFEEANPDVEVEVTSIPWDSAQNKYQTAIAGGSTPDIGMLGSDWLPGFATALTPVPSEIDTSGIFPFAVESANIDGTLLGVPWYVETRVIFHRTDLMKEAGFEEFPTDWDGLKELARAYKEKAGADFGIAIPAGGWNGFIGTLPFDYSGGAEVMDADQQEWTIDTPEMVQSLEYLKSYFDEGLADNRPSTETGSASANLVSGSVPMFLSGPWDIGGLETAGGPGFEDKFDVAMIPAAPGATSKSFAAGANLAVFKGAENPDAAWKLIEWLNQPEVQVDWFETVRDLPAQQSSWEDDALTSDPMIAVFGEQLESVGIAPTVSTWSEVSAAADTQMERIFRGGADVQETLTELQATADGLGTSR